MEQKSGWKKGGKHPNVLLSVYKHAKTTQRKKYSAGAECEKKIGNLRVLQCFISGQKEFQQGVELFFAEITKLY